MGDPEREPSDRPEAPPAAAGERRGRLLAGLFLVLGAVGLPVTAVRALGDTGGPGASVGEVTPFVQLLALTPWFALPCLAGLVVAILARRRLVVAVFAVFVLAHAVWLTPAVVAAGPGAREVDLTVLSVNGYGGFVDVDDLLSEVRESDVDVLVVVELTEELVARLREAGLEDELAHTELLPETAAAGSGIWSRYPLRALPTVSDSTFAMPRAEVFLGTADDAQEPGDGAGEPGDGLVVTAVHPVPPLPGSTGRWRSDLDAVQRVAAATDGVQVVAGDFNATRDHAAFRDVVRTVGRDAATDRGRGLRPTWPADAAVVTIDHVLVSRDIRVGDVDRVTLDGTDHVALVVELDLPEGVEGVPETG